MCRITGFLDFNEQHIYDRPATLVKMRDTLAYGGPDNGGQYISENLFLGHRRLSIIDLSEAGNQPFEWDNFVLVFNGEIYNYQEIRHELQALGYTFQSDSDTEVILKSFKAWGKKAVHRYRGMFAFTLWDKDTQKLLLCRDRVGVKPLFWYWKDGLFLFASELKAFHEHPYFDKTINQKAVSLFLQQGYITAPLSIFEYAHKVNAGHFVEIDTTTQAITIESYWDIEIIFEQKTLDTRPENLILEELEPLLSESFGLRMVADVPVGMFLSGGIDSSLVVALLQKQTNQQLKTFTIGFEDERFNEAHFAKKIAQHIGTDHTELYCSEADFKEVIPKIADFYDEPFGDSSCIPTFIVAQLAKQQVKVSLSADGGDEVFGGYTKYEIAKNFFPKFQKIPRQVRQLLHHVASPINPNWVEKNASKLPILRGYSGVGNKFSKFKKGIGATDMVDFFNQSSTYTTSEGLKKLFPLYEPRFESKMSLPDEERLISYLGIIDIKTYLEGDIMTKVDRATMQVALEGREPFLDHKIIEFACALPDSLKIKDKQAKYLLRKILYKYVPQEMIERPKQGFAIPLEQWLRTDALQAELKSLCHDTAFINTFQFQEKVLQKLIFDFLNNKRYQNAHFIWFLYTLFSWYKRWIVKS
jgi:asparagine synthase (glutamine-hydrolysing)